MAGSPGLRTTQQQTSRGSAMGGWHRKHRLEGDRTAVARAYPLDGSFRASVSDGEPTKVASDVTCDDIEAAKNRADEMIIEAYPHNCIQEHCDQWTPNAD